MNEQIWMIQFMKTPTGILGDYDWDAEMDGWAAFGIDETKPHIVLTDSSGGVSELNMPELFALAEKAAMASNSDKYDLREQVERAVLREVRKMNAAGRKRW